MLTSQLALLVLSLAATPDANVLKRLSSRLAPVELKVDLAGLPASERGALGKLLEAAQVMDAIFARQSWAGSETMLRVLIGDSSALGKLRLRAFLQNGGPWLRLDDNRPFMPGVGAKPGGADFYPAAASKEDVERWMKGLAAEEKAQATSFFTVIRRGLDGKFLTVPYSVEYQGALGRAAELLREAATLSAEPTLKDFLAKRADAFLSNRYYESDLAWMKLEGALEPTIGPYEVYEDEWFNLKAAFEAFITVRDDAETAKLSKFSAELQDIEDHLPIEPKLRNPKLGALAPIRVVNSLYCSGDANHGVQTAAYNLPNDEKIGQEFGTKRTMLKNVQEAKFSVVLMPIAKVALAPAARKEVAFDAFFTHILMHELMHGLGPHNITVGGKDTTVRAQFQETYSALEEAKADISGLFALQHLIDKGVVDRKMERTLYTTFLASCFRSIRFGLSEAHGKGIALQMNYLLDAGAYRVAADGTFSVDAAKAKEAVKRLTGDLMTLQASGDRKKAVELLSSMAVIRPAVKNVLDRLKTVPVDIEPRFVTAERILRELK